MLVGLSCMTRAGLQELWRSIPVFYSGRNWAAARGTHDSAATAISFGVFAVARASLRGYRFSMQSTRTNLRGFWFSADV